MTEHSLDLSLRMPEIPARTSANLFTEPSFLTSFREVTPANNRFAGTQLEFANPYPDQFAAVATASTPLLDGALKEQLGKTGAIDFTTPGDNQVRGRYGHRFRDRTRGWHRCRCQQSSTAQRHPAEGLVQAEWRRRPAFRIRG